MPPPSPLGGASILQEEEASVPEEKKLEEKGPGEVDEKEIDKLIEEAKVGAEAEMARQEAEEELQRRQKALEQRGEEEGDQVVQHPAPLLGTAPIKVHYKGKVRNLVDGLGSRRKNLS